MQQPRYSVSKSQPKFLLPAYSGDSVIYRPTAIYTGGAVRPTYCGIPRVFSLDLLDSVRIIFTF
jgi:hypothetical protein